MTTADATRPRLPDLPGTDVDARLLGFEATSDPSRVHYEVTPHLCRPDGAFYGGTGIAAVLSAMELATRRPALWATTQFVSSARLGERIDSQVEPVARGRYVDQLRISGLVGDRLLYAGLGSTATWRPDGLSGTGPVMPKVVPPADCPVFDPLRGAEMSRELGQHLVVEFRESPLPEAEQRLGHLTMWARLRGETATSAAKLAFVADMVPLAVCRAAGVVGAGFSLDNSLRVAKLVDTEWVLLDLHGHVAHAGYGHGNVKVWSPDGTLMATGSQTAKLFSFESLVARRTPR